VVSLRSTTGFYEPTLVKPQPRFFLFSWQIHITAQIFCAVPGLAACVPRVFVPAATQPAFCLIIQASGEAESGSAGVQPDEEYPGRQRADGASGSERRYLSEPSSPPSDAGAMPQKTQPAALPSARFSPSQPPAPGRRTLAYRFALTHACFVSIVDSALHPPSNPSPGGCLSSERHPAPSTCFYPCRVSLVAPDAYSPRRRLLQPWCGAAHLIVGSVEPAGGTARPDQELVPR
jgi:hypothetical protein